MTEKDIRWKQRFANFNKAFNQLKKFIDKGGLNELEKQGLIQSFEDTYELAWNVIKDYYEFQGETNIQGSRDAFRLAVNRELVDNGDLWMEMIQSRQRTSHTYNEEIAEEISRNIFETYYGLFKQLSEKLENIENS